jgi:hypothetical protein
MKEIQCSFDVLCLLDLVVPHTSLGDVMGYLFLPMLLFVEMYFS